MGRSYSLPPRVKPNPNSNPNSNPKINANFNPNFNPNAKADATPPAISRAPVTSLTATRRSAIPRQTGPPNAVPAAARSPARSRWNSSAS
jgi:hypothetical protein